MSFKDQSFANRLGAMGDEAEAIFEEHWATSWVRYGLNRPPVSMARMSPIVRYTPDYLTPTRLVEVQGVGRDHMFKLKIEKLCALAMWDAFMPVDLFVWDSHNKQYGHVSLDVLQAALKDSSVCSFADSKPKPYHALDIGLLPVDWIKP